MKRSLLLFALMLIGTASFAQWDTCEPDEAFADSTAGVYPLPYDEVENPDGGIPDSACLNMNYQFVFTAVINDTLTLGMTAIELDSLVLNTEGAVTGLPQGIDYACNPPTCVFEANTTGCVVLYGNPDNPANLGDNELVITATIYGPFFPLGTELTFPNPQLFPGSYSLYVHEENYPNCSVFISAGEVNLQLEEIRNIPNPFSSQTVIEVTALEADDYQFTVTDLMGRTVHQQSIRMQEGQNQIEFDGSNLANGVYLYSFHNQNGIATRKMLIQH